MNSQILFCSLLLATASFFTFISANKIPRLSPILRAFEDSLDAASKPTLSDYLETHFYDQTIDHFNYKPESYATFKQRYFINPKYWGGPNSSAPIFVYLGAEGNLDIDVMDIGFLDENAPQFKALVVYIEHRFYGQSNPVGSMEKALKNERARGYFSSVQALADYADVVLHIKKKYSAQNSPVIVIGGSYGGMLGSWFRLKYPHIALGALASSAPILYFGNITPEDGYYSVVTKDFKEVSQNCYNTIRNSWAEIDRIASKLDGLSILSKKFKTCEPLKEASELKDYLHMMYATAAQYNAPPKYPVTEICRGINGAPKGAGILDMIFAGVKSYRGSDMECFYMARSSSQTDYGWSWQACTDMVMPIGITKEDSMFPKSPYSLSNIINYCKRKFGVTPRPHWVSTYYGGHDIKLVLNKFASNIIFSNGLRDPYSRGGVLEDISDNVLAVHTVNGSHCLDILVAKKDDPDWLVKQRKHEVNIIKVWIEKYYHDLRASHR